MTIVGKCYDTNEEIAINYDHVASIEIIDKNDTECVRPVPNGNHIIQIIDTNNSIYFIIPWASSETNSLTIVKSIFTGIMKSITNGEPLFNILYGFIEKN